jgi:16S rRNA (adenine1518-N6/adenine1519-N6)-dimethyltransferase
MGNRPQPKKAPRHAPQKVGSHASTGTPAETIPLRAQRSLSQNFLHDESILRRMLECICSAAPATESKPVAVEIGPGTGALTAHLLKQFSVLAIEKDPRAIPLLRSRFLPPQLEDRQPQLCTFAVTEQDILSMDGAELAAMATAVCAETAHNGASDKVHRAISKQTAKPILVGNLPYGISSEILIWSCKASSFFSSCHFLLQREVVERLAAQPGTREYGRIGVLLSLYFDVTQHFEVPPEAFVPRPRVTSSFFSMIPKPSPFRDAAALKTFEHVTAFLFSRRRKMLRRTLEQLFTSSNISYHDNQQGVIALLALFGIAPEDRPERIPPKGFFALAEFLHDRLRQPAVPVGGSQ